MTETEPKSTTTKQRTRTGAVSSISGEKTIRVTVSMLVKHPRYGKYMRRRSNIAAHDPANQAALGDIVEIAPCRPISKRKSWRLVRIVRSEAVRSEATAQ
jgi:small subunit ribosomal protein S17